MNYQRIYNLLVQKAQDRKEIPDVIEKHHILPKSMGGSNSKSNIVFFTPKEHYVSHHLLWKIYRNKEMHYAFWLMVNKTSSDGRRVYKVNSRTYSLAKEEHRLQVSKTHTGKTRSEESKRKSGSAIKGRIPWNKGLTGVYSKETLEKISKAARNRIPESEDTKRKKSLSHIGIKKGPSPLKGKSMPVDNKWFVICPNCNKKGTNWNMKRYHFENCKKARK